MVAKDFTSRDMLILFDLRILGCLTATSPRSVSGSCPFLDRPGRPHRQGTAAQAPPDCPDPRHRGDCLTRRGINSVGRLPAGSAGDDVCLRVCADVMLDADVVADYDRGEIPALPRTRPGQLEDQGWIVLADDQQGARGYLVSL